MNYCMLMTQSFTRSPKTVAKLLGKIQTEGEKYGPKVNEKKCEAITVTKQSEMLNNNVCETTFKNGKSQTN